MLVALPAVVGIENADDFRVVEIARIKVTDLRHGGIESQLVHVAVVVGVVGAGAVPYAGVPDVEGAGWTG